MMEIKADRLIAAVPDRVMRALATPGDLARWCCDAAQVDDATYRLTGRTLPTGALGGRLLERSGRTLRFEWTLNGTPSEVTITLEGAPQTGNPPAEFTRVLVTHSGIPGDAAPVASPEEFWQCAWVLWLRNLQLWVERAEAPGRFDYAAAPLPVVERSLVMDAPAAQVWRAITDPALRARWCEEQLGPETRREEGRLVAFSWRVGSAATGTATATEVRLQLEPPGEVAFHLEPLSDGRTRVAIRHDGLSKAPVDYHLGWHDNLVALHQETARPVIRQTVWIKAAPARVWPYVATQDGLRRWFSENVRFEPQVGAPYALQAHGGTLGGQVVACEPPTKLVFTWTEEGEEWPEPLLLTLDLAPEDGGTRVTLTQSGFEKLPAADFAGYQRGWAPGSSMIELKEAVEGAEQVA